MTGICGGVENGGFLWWIMGVCGSHQTATVSAISALCEEPLDAMKRNGELSGYKVYINPRQRILQTSKLEIVLKIVPVGTMREIEVAIGFALSV